MGVESFLGPFEVHWAHYGTHFERKWIPNLVYWAKLFCGPILAMISGPTLHPCSRIWSCFIYCRCVVSILKKTNEQHKKNSGLLMWYPVGLNVTFRPSKSLHQKTCSPKISQILTFHSIFPTLKRLELKLLASCNCGRFVFWGLCISASTWVACLSEISSKFKIRPGEIVPICQSTVSTVWCMSNVFERKGFGVCADCLPRGDAMVLLLFKFSGGAPMIELMVKA